MSKPDYDTTLARMAGNIVGALYADDRLLPEKTAVEKGVRLARAIVAEVKRTAPAPDTETP